MKKILIAFLLLIPATHAWCLTTVSGVVVDKADNLPLLGAGACVKGTNLCVMTDDETGKFKLSYEENNYKNARIEISASAYVSQTFDPAPNLGTIKLSTETLENAAVRPCSTEELRIQDVNATSGSWHQGYEDAQDEDGRKTYCRITKCKSGFKLQEDNSCMTKIGEPCPKQTLSKYEHAAAGIVTNWDIKTEDILDCKITNCENGYEPKNDGKSCIKNTCECLKRWDSSTQTCVDKDKTCTAPNASSATLQCENGQEICRIERCSDGYIEVRDDNDKITSCKSDNGQDCLSTLPDDSHASVATYDKNHNCVIRACKNTDDGKKYKLQNGNCVVSATVATDKEVEDLKDKADAAHAKENSLANKTIAATGMATTAAGAQMALSALSEKTADENIENEMRAYLETFRCEYGDNKSARSGATNVELPGGNDMFNLYAQYATLANDLKIRKEALGIKPGIESEIVIDKTETGLYDDVGTGITGGNYISVARALMDPNGEDAKRWAAQKAETAEKLQTGVKVAAIGAAASLAANIAVNYDTIKKKYSGLKQPLKELQENLNANPKQKCSEFSGTTNEGTAPDCRCIKSNERFFPDDGGCKPCTGGKQYDENNECVCPKDTREETNGTCVPKEPDCQLSGDVADGCACMQDAAQNGNICECPYGTENGQCIKQTSKQEEKRPDDNTLIDELSFTASSDNLFAPSSSKLTKEANEDLARFLLQVRDAQKTYNFDLSKDNDYCLVIVGKTDRTKFKTDSSMNNQKLSENRANAVRDVLTSGDNAFNANNIKTYGVADTYCDQTNHPKANDAQCRRVDINIWTGACDSETDYSNPENVKKN